MTSLMTLRNEHSPPYWLNSLQRIQQLSQHDIGPIRRFTMTSFFELSELYKYALGLRFLSIVPLPPFDSLYRSQSLNRHIGTMSFCPIKVVFPNDCTDSEALRVYEKNRRLGAERIQVLL